MSHLFSADEVFPCAKNSVPTGPSILWLSLESTNSENAVVQSVEGVTMLLKSDESPPAGLRKMTQPTE